MAALMLAVGQEEASRAGSRGLCGAAVRGWLAYRLVYGGCFP